VSIREERQCTQFAYILILVTLFTECELLSLIISRYQGKEYQ